MYWKGEMRSAYNINQDKINAANWVGTQVEI
jgi:hypothetical protein